MSYLIARVSQIQNYESLHIVKFQCNTQSLSMMSLDLDGKVKVGTKVKLVLKPSHIAIAKEFSGAVSYSNQLACTIKFLENGQLLSAIKLDFFGATLESIITLESSQKMRLKVGDRVTAFIKASELSIGEVLGV